MTDALTVKDDSLAALVDEQGVSTLLKPLIREIYLFDSYVAGTTHLQDASVLDTVREGDKLLLQREQQNRFDAKAIAVCTQDGRKLGYVPERDNLIFARLMDAGKVLSARISGIRVKGTFHEIGIGIYLMDF